MLGGLFGQPKKFVQIPGVLYPLDLLSMVVELPTRRSPVVQFFALLSSYDTLQ